MSYATIADAVAIHGSDYVITSCDRNSDGTLDSDAFQRHLDGATDEIDSYLVGRYDLPLLSIPRILVIHCVNMAIASACAEAGPLSERKESLEKKAITFLEAVSSGKRRLIANGSASTGANKSRSAELINAKETISLLEHGSRHFTREKMKDL